MNVAARAENCGFFLKYTMIQWIEEWSSSSFVEPIPDLRFYFKNFFFPKIELQNSGCGLYSGVYGILHMKNWGAYHSAKKSGNFGYSKF